MSKINRQEREMHAVEFPNDRYTKTEFSLQNIRDIGIRMSWSRLPDLALERIINFAVEKDYREMKVSWNTCKRDGAWIMFVQKYGKVCLQWKNVIFQSKLLFYGENQKQLDKWYYPYPFSPRFRCEPKSSIVVRLLTGYENIEELEKQRKIRQMIKNGYMQVAKELHLYMIGAGENKLEDHIQTINLLRQYVGDSSIQSFCLTARYNSNKVYPPFLPSFVDVLKEIKQLNQVNIYMVVESQNGAEVCWNSLLEIIQIQKLKAVNFRIDTVDWRPSMPFVNWDFITQHVSSDKRIDHIKNITLKTQTLNSVRNPSERIFTFDCDPNNLTVAGFAQMFAG